MLSSTSQFKVVLPSVGAFDDSSSSAFANVLVNSWVSANPGLTRKQLAFWRGFFREVAHRAKAWRQDHPEAGLRELDAALNRLMGEAEAPFGRDALGMPFIPSEIPRSEDGRKAPRTRRIGRTMTNRLAERMNDDWSARTPGLPAEELAFSLQFFREVYYRARLWREAEPDAGIDAEADALDRILRETEKELEVKTGKRLLLIDLLLRDLRATIWRRRRSRRR